MSANRSEKTLGAGTKNSASEVRGMSFNSSVEFMQHDLEKSGLSAEDLNCRPIGLAEAGACDVSAAQMGYVIPYFDIDGSPAPFYRARLLNYHIAGKPVKYKQIKGQPNRIYFPKQLKRALQGKNYIVICEGEKKAVTSCLHGIPAVGLTGVDSWRNRTLVIPKDVQTVKIQGNKGDSQKIGIRLPSGTQELDDITQTTYAEGFDKLTELIIARKLHAVIAFDSDGNNKANFSVQRAAASLAFELRFRGIPYNKINQFMIPNDTEEKVGYDDFILADADAGESPERTVTAVLGLRGSFPKHPNLREWLNKRLQRTKLGRKETHMVAMAVLSDLDTRGKRLRAKDSGFLYYFDSDTKSLMKVHFSGARKEEVHESEFGRLLYNRYGITGGDQRILTQLSAQYSAEDPIEEVHPQRVIGRIFETSQTSSKAFAKLVDSICYQISDGQYIRISGDATNPFEICDNGDYNVLFESGHVEPVNVRDLSTALKQEQYRIRQGGKLKNLWYETLLKTRMKDKEQSALLFSYLYYISPWLWRWKGTQLPAEIVLGEAGSGKSSAYILRLQILTGNPILRNAPKDIENWHTSVVNTGALHVVDNLHMANKQLRQQLSDEMCRLITEPNPSVEQRRLYSNAELMRLQVSTVFAITAIQQPFQNIDILQRSMVMEMDKAGSLKEGEKLEYQSDWSDDQLRMHGGRVGWLVNHIMVLHSILHKARQNWDYTYKATHRLVNFEYLLGITARVFGDDPAVLKAALNDKADERMVEADWVLEGLRAYCDGIRARHTPDTLAAVTTTTEAIANWALGNEEFTDCIQLTNSRKLGRYITSNRHTIQTAAGLMESGMVLNRTHYRILPKD